MSRGSKRKKALSLPLNLSHGKDKAFSLRFCRFSKSLNSVFFFYDKLGLRFNLGLQSPRCRKAGRQEVRKEGSAARQAAQAEKYEKQNSGCKRRPGWREVLRERQVGRQVPRNPSSRGSNKAGRQAGLKVGRKCYKVQKRTRTVKRHSYALAVTVGRAVLNQENQRSVGVRAGLGSAGQSIELCSAAGVGVQ